jgi:SpoIID/LytB domain protein
MRIALLFTFLLSGFAHAAPLPQPTSQDMPATTPPALTAPPALIALRPAPPLPEYRALKAWYAGNIEWSIFAFEQLLALQPNNGRIKRQLVHLYHEAGKAPLAVRMLDDLRQVPEPRFALEKELFITACLAADYATARALLPLSQEDADTLFYEALLRRDTGDSERAAALLRQSLALEDFRPIAWFFLGELIAAASPAEAEKCFRTALKQDGNLRHIYYPLGKVLLAQGRRQEAFSNFNTAHRYFPDNAAVSAAWEQARAALPQAPTAPQTAPQVAPRRGVIAGNPPKTKNALGSAAAGLPMVRVGLAEGLASVTVKAGGAYSLIGANGTRLHSGEAREQLWAEAREREVIITDRAGKELASSDAPVFLMYDDTDGSAVESTTIVSGFTGENRTYRGSIKFHPTEDGLTLVNILNLEEYLYGVIPSEMPPYWPFEALKAQAIAARSYTIAYMGQYEERGFDLYGSVMSAAYRGFGGEARETTAAVDATRGLYLEAEHAPLRAYYSANHGGYSEDSRSVWGTNTFMAAVADKLLAPRSTFLPVDELALWLSSRPSSYSSVEKLHSAQAYRWEKWVAARELSAKYEVGDVLRVVSRGRGISGRINEVELLGNKGRISIEGDRIRSGLGGLRSNLFTIRVKTGADGLPEYFIFQGAGWGHGVGLDQTGAAGMASAGYTASQILKHYYPLAHIADERKTL